jgi:hypothetical protein
MHLTPLNHFDPLDHTDESLIWNLNGFRDHMRAVNFVRRFRQYLCVYSYGVHQLYGSYEILVPRRQNSHLVVVPDLFSFHDTWYHLRDKALRRTGLMILPGELVGREGLYLRIPFDDGRRGRAVPLANGLRAIRRQWQEKGDDFLPVITRGDLRAVRRQTPLLHLHHLDVRAMRDKSRFEINDMSRTIRERMLGLIGGS